MCAINSRTSMFNLTRPTQSVNIYITKQRYENHLWYLVNLSLQLRKKDIPICYLTPIDFEIKWCFNAWCEINERIEQLESGAYPFGL